MVPAIRIRAANDAPVRADGEFVLYWMIAFRRARWNFALERAAGWAAKLNRPLIVFEPLRCDYPWASDRFHTFVLEGMAGNAAELARKPAFYYPYIEPSHDAGKGLLAALAAHACVTVTDDFPCFFLPHAVRAAARRVPVCLEVVDSNGLLPMCAADHAFPSAHTFRRFLQKTLPAHLAEFPKQDPLRGLKVPHLAAIPAEIARRWPPVSAESLSAAEQVLASLPIDHRVSKAPAPGGAESARKALSVFLKSRLAHYPADRNAPEKDATSGLSPYLHFGHISAHEVFSDAMSHEGWSVDDLSHAKASGRREGWWGAGEAADAFLDQLITWRELGFNFCARRDDYDRYESLPGWALATLATHALDRRAHVYSLEQFERARTHDPLWNAAQMQLAREGRIHNYLRMLWGKKILEWSASPPEALRVMIELNNKYALDGRDPNSYSGIFWVLGRYDRPWGPERPIFGKVRYMSSENTAHKFKVDEYIRKYAPPG